MFDLNFRTTPCVIGKNIQRHLLPTQVATRTKWLPVLPLPTADSLDGVIGLIDRVSVCAWEREREWERGGKEREREKSGSSEWAGGMTVQQKQLVQKETGSLCCHQNISYATVTVDSAVLLCSTPPRVPLRVSLLSNTLYHKTIEISLLSSRLPKAASTARNSFSYRLPFSLCEITSC